MSKMTRKLNKRVNKDKQETFRKCMVHARPKFLSHYRKIELEPHNVDYDQLWAYLIRGETVNCRIIFYLITQRY